jgi:hypothetical protein
MKSCACVLVVLALFIGGCEDGSVEADAAVGTDAIVTADGAGVVEQGAVADGAQSETALVDADYADSGMSNSDAIASSTETAPIDADE